MLFNVDSLILIRLEKERLRNGFSYPNVLKQGFDASLFLCVRVDKMES